ncbi:MAG TPA: tyrosine-type recombinase/integrase [Oculatellaceae cyanobacterium]
MKVEVKCPTLAEVWNDYQTVRHLKETTRKNYAKRLRNHVGDWMSLPIDKITKRMVEDRHKEINGKANANSTMRTVRALLFFAIAKYEDDSGESLISVNPVTRLSELRQWHKDKRRKSVIPFAQLKAFYKAVWSLENHTARDYLLTLLFTGLRSFECACLRWDQVNLKVGTITILQSVAKNGEEHTIPMCTYLWKVMQVRQLHSSTAFVFPGKMRHTHLTSVQKSLQAVRQRSSITFSLHDIRRTFISIADDLDIKDGVVKELVNHRRSDVTEGYTIRSTERLRRATQKISEHILSQIEQDEDCSEKTVSDLINRYAKLRTIPDDVLFTYRRALRQVGVLNTPVCNISDEVIDGIEAEFAGSKEALVMWRSLMSYAETQGLLPPGPKKHTR